MPTRLAKRSFGSRHPLGEPARQYWAADYWVTLLTSGLLTAAHRSPDCLLVAVPRLPACAGVLCSGLAYGLATPAYVYATLAYGHQATAFALFTLVLPALEERPRPAPGSDRSRRVSGRLRRRGRASRRSGVRVLGVYLLGPVRLAVSAG